MSKEVLVDTSFFEKMTCGGNHVDIFDKMVLEAGYLPVVHPYLAKYELDVRPYFKRLCASDKVRIASYDEFLEDETDRITYVNQFMVIHEELRKVMDTNNSRKHLDKLTLPKGMTVFNYRKAGMSLGDVHMILMAFYTGIPVIFTEDSDIDILRSITRRYISSDNYTLDIMNAVDIIRSDVSSAGFMIEKKELENMVKLIGERHNLADIKTAWKDAHGDE